MFNIKWELLKAIIEFNINIQEHLYNINSILLNELRSMHEERYGKDQEDD